MDTKTMLLMGALKAAPDGNTFEGWASTSALDKQGDVVEPTAFARSLSRFLDNGPIFWAHEEAYNPVAKPIGKAVDARIADNGLWIKAKWASTPQAQEVRSLVLDGIVDRLSVGFRPVQMHRDSALGHNVITEADLVEVSVVPIPANDEARIVAAKAWLAAPHPAPKRRRVVSELA